MIENDWFLAYIVENPGDAVLLGGALAVILLELRYKLIGKLMAKGGDGGRYGGGSGNCDGDG